MRKIKIAQIGIGHDHANGIYPGILALPDLFEVVGFAVPPEEKGRFPEKYAGKWYQTTREMTVEEILNDPTIEAVTVETEEVLLSKYALLAFEHGKHIHMDKPGGIVPEDFKKMLQTAKAKGLVFHQGYMYRYNPYVIEIMEQIKNGEFGQIFSVETHMDCTHTPEKRQWLDQFPGGMLFFLGCHLIDLIVQICGVPENIIPLSCCTGLEGVTAQDYGMAVLQYKNGVSFAKTCARELGGYNRRQLVITGEKKSVELKPFEMFGEKNLYTDRVEYTDLETSIKNWGYKGTASHSPEYDRYEAMMSGFAAMVRGEKENPWTYDYEWQLYRILLRCCGVEIDYKTPEIL